MNGLHKGVGVIRCRLMKWLAAPWNKATAPLFASQSGHSLGGPWAT